MTGDLPLPAVRVLLRMLVWGGGAFASMSVVLGWQLAGPSPPDRDDAAAARSLALAAIAGHSWSVFLRFKGGRGVNTFLGGLMVMYWPAAIAGGAIMVIIGLISKFMSLGSITGAVVSFIMLIILNYTDANILNLNPHFAYVVYAMIGAVFIYVMHRDNIRRLVTGRERKLGEKTKTENTPAAGN